MLELAQQFGPVSRETRRSRPTLGPAIRPPATRDDCRRRGRDGRKRLSVSAIAIAILAYTDRIPPTVASTHGPDETTTAVAEVLRDTNPRAYVRARLHSKRA